MVEEMGGKFINLSIKHFIIIFYRLFIYLFSYLFIALTLSHVFSVVKANIEEMKKALHLLFWTFHFFPKIISYHESSSRKNKSVKISGYVIPAKSYPSNHSCRTKKNFLGLQYVQELWSLCDMRFTTFKNQACTLVSSTGLVSSSLGN